MKALIDGDILLYRIGFAIEKTSHFVFDISELDTPKDRYNNSIVDVIEYGEPCASFTKLSTALAWVNLDKDYIIKPVTYPEPIEQGYYLLDKYISKILHRTNSNDCTIYFSDRDRNFRKELHPAYKRNRDSARKPVHYRGLQEYCFNHWPCESATGGLEADDLLGIAGYKAYQDAWEEAQDLTLDLCDVTICTTDKDLDMIPGWHYNFVTEERRWVNWFEAFRNFYLQVLSGDPTDNVQGIPGMGPITANKALDKSAYSNPRDQFYRVKDLYKKNHLDEDYLRTMGNLLWIWRKEYSSLEEVTKEWYKDIPLEV